MPRYSARFTVGVAGEAVSLWRGGPPDLPRFADTGTIVALRSNNGVIVYGDSDVVATTGSVQGVYLSQGESVPITNVCLDCLWIDAENAGDGVTVVWESDASRTA